MDPIEETLKTARVIQRTSMLVLIATLVFLVSPSEAPRYKASLQAVDSLRVANLEGFREFQEDLLEKASNRAAFWRALVMPQMNRPYVVSRNLALILRNDIPDDLSEKVLTDWPLRRYQSWISKNLERNVLSLTLDGEKVRQMLEEIAKSKTEGFRCLDKAKVLTGPEALTGIRSGRTLRGNHIVRVTLSRYESQDCKGSGEQITLDFPAKPLKVEKSSLMDYLKESQNVAVDMIFSKGEGEFIFLPPTEAVWAEIMDMQVSDAIGYLKRSAERTENKMQVFGVSVSASVVSIIIPLVILALSFGLSLYLRHLGCLADKDTRHLIRDFPWFVLFRDPLPKFITFLNLVVFPIGACLMIFALFSMVNMLTMSLGILCIILLIISTARNIYFVQKLTRN